ncbi:ArsC family reductase [Sphingobacterium sp. DR205]|uniref:ArsC family reductase n=1 Tax=Sphingobacterium sp. DR205 TaxID=2713573 RepID=UPI003216FCD8
MIKFELTNIGIIMLQVYGIKNCNTVKKALTWLEENQIDFQFHDFKKEGVSDEKLKEWEKKVDWQSLVNKKGTTWKKLTIEEQAQVVDASSANKVLKDHTSMIKRPVIEYGKGILLGFSEDDYKINLK